MFSLNLLHSVIENIVITTKGLEHAILETSMLPHNQKVRDPYIDPNSCFSDLSDSLNSLNSMNFPSI